MLNKCDFENKLILILVNNINIQRALISGGLDDTKDIVAPVGLVADHNQEETSQEQARLREDKYEEIRRDEKKQAGQVPPPALGVSFLLFHTMIFSNCRWKLCQ